MQMMCGSRVCRVYHGVLVGQQGDDSADSYVADIPHSRDAAPPLSEQFHRPGAAQEPTGRACTQAAVWGSAAARATVFTQFGTDLLITVNLT